MVRETSVRRGPPVEYFTIAWNSLEAVIAIVAGLLAGSIALVGFGLDSVIEVTSGGALLWRLRTDADHAKRERVELISLRIVGVLSGARCLHRLRGCVLARFTEAPDESIPGILLACASVIVMPILARAKRRVAASIGSAAMRADAKQTDLAVRICRRSCSAGC